MHDVHPSCLPPARSLMLTVLGWRPLCGDINRYCAMLVEVYDMLWREGDGRVLFHWTELSCLSSRHSCLTGPGCLPDCLQVDINLVLGAGSAVAAPVLRDVSQRGLSSISSEIGQLEDAMFSNPNHDETQLLSGEQLALGTFSIHNLGMLDCPNSPSSSMAFLVIIIIICCLPSFHPSRRYIRSQVRRSNSDDPAGLCAVPGVDSRHRSTLRRPGPGVGRRSTDGGHPVVRPPRS